MIVIIDCDTPLFFIFKSFFAAFKFFFPNIQAFDSRDIGEFFGSWKILLQQTPIPTHPFGNRNKPQNR